METFALVVAGAAAAALLLMVLRKNRTGIRTGTAFLFGALAVPLCILAGRAAYWLCLIEWLSRTKTSFWDFAGSGYTAR